VPDADPRFECVIPAGSIQVILSGTRLEAKRRLLAAVGAAATVPTSPRPGPPEFAKFIKDPDLVTVLVGRWREAEAAERAGAFLSTVIMLGSLLEGALLARVQQDPKAANTAKCSPKDDEGKVLPFAQWTLSVLIAVAHEVGWIGQDVRDFSSRLREYRNLVHPNEQRHQQFFPDAHTCNLAWAATGAALAALAR
jgi:hypothetical protein